MTVDVYEAMWDDEHSSGAPPGMVGFVHAYYVFGLGYGGRIHSARFKALAKPGPPLLLACKATQHRRSPDKLRARYDLRFTQEGTLVYEGDQTALWMDEASPLVTGRRRVTSMAQFPGSGQVHPTRAYLARHRPPWRNENARPSPRTLVLQL